MKLATLILASAAALLAQPAQTPLDFPMSMAVSPDGKFVLALNAGTKTSISVMSTSPLREISRVPVEDAWLGLTFAPGGRLAYVGGGGRGSVFEFSFSQTGELKPTREMKVSDFIGDVTLSPDGRLIYAADLYANVIVVINPQSGRVIDRFKTGRRPYRIVFHPDGKSYFVSNWADASVVQYSAVNGEEVGRIRLGPHPTDMVLSDYKPPVEEGQEPLAWKYRLFVAAANTNNVFAVGIGENKTMQLADTISVSPTPLSPLGMTPSALALSPDQKRLFIACSDANAIVAVDISDVRGVVEGFLPTGRYPTAVRVSGGGVLVTGGHSNDLRFIDAGDPKPLGPPELPNEPKDSAPGTHVIYVLGPTLSAEELMRAVAGTAPDYTVKLGRRANFDVADPANSPAAGYLWTNARAKGLAVRNYGVFVRNGQVLDPALKAFTSPAASFLEDLKQFEAAGTMPALILIELGDDPAALARITDAVKKSRFSGTTTIVSDGSLQKVESLLALRPMTRNDR